MSLDISESSVLKLTEYKSKGSYLCRYSVSMAFSLFQMQFH